MSRYVELFDKTFTIMFELYMYIINVTLIFTKHTIFKTGIKLQTLLQVLDKETLYMYSDLFLENLY